MLDNFGNLVKDEDNLIYPKKLTGQHTAPSATFSGEAQKEYESFGELKDMLQINATPSVYQEFSHLKTQEEGSTESIEGAIPF